MKQLTEENFDAFIAAPSVMVDFWATWCGPCQIQGKRLEQLVVNHPELADSIGKVNVDDARNLAVRYGINAIPALLFFKNGQLSQTLVGLQDDDTILANLR